jgi:hypothetical protein
LFYTCRIESHPPGEKALHDFEDVLTYQFEKRRPRSRAGHQTAVHGSISRTDEKVTSKPEEAEVLEEPLELQEELREEGTAADAVEGKATGPNNVEIGDQRELPITSGAEQDASQTNRQETSEAVVPQASSGLPPPVPCQSPSPAEINHPSHDSCPQSITAVTPMDKEAAKAEGANGAETAGDGRTVNNDMADHGKGDNTNTCNAGGAGNGAGTVTEPEIVTPAQPIGARFNQPSVLATYTLPTYSCPSVPPSTAGKGDRAPGLFQSSTPAPHLTSVAKKEGHQFKSPPPRTVVAPKKRKESVQKGMMSGAKARRNGIDGLLNIDMTKYGRGPILKRPPTCPPLFKSDSVMQPGKARQVAAINNKYYSHERNLISLWTPPAEVHATPISFKDASSLKPVDALVTSVYPTNSMITNNSVISTPCPGHSQIGATLEWACRQLSNKK